MTDFDWVSARAKCSLVPLFEKLYLEIEQDISHINEILGDGYICKLIKNGDRAFSVVLHDHFDQGQAVRFRLVNGAIVASRGVDDSAFASATPTLSDDKECRLLVDGKERELWQFLKLALEGLFFQW